LSSEERTWQRNEVFNWKPELFEYLRSSLFFLDNRFKEDLRVYEKASWIGERPLTNE